MIGRRAVVVRRGPGLIGAAARTAVVAGTATAVSGAVANKQAARAQQATATQAAAEPAPAPAAPAAAAGPDQLGQLERLADLKAQGVLTDEEFSAAKAKLLGL